MKITVLSIVICFIISFSYGQNTPDKRLVTIPPPPEASSLFKFVETPVSEFTGLANIVVPIYDIKLGKFSFPISIKYHSAGNKLAEQSSNVGLGWALEAGGQISSTVMGKPDFSGLGNYYFSHFPLNRELRPSAGLGNQGWYENDDYSLLKMLAGNPVMTGPGEYNPLPSSIYDTQPDIFYFSSFDKAGKFFYANQQAHTIPYRNIKIDRNLPSDPSFRITDEEGTVFIYSVQEQTNTSINVTGTAGWAGNGDFSFNTAFYLSRVITLAQDTLNISYNTTRYNYSNVAVYSRYQSISSQPGCIYTNASTQTNSDTDVLDGKFISEITSNRGHKIKFIYNSCSRLDLPGTFALQRIEITKGDAIETVDLNHEYFNLPNYDCNTQVDKNFVKLKLKSLKKSGESPYTFDYYLENERFPDRLSNETDHWGYYNGVGGIFPPEPAIGLIDGADKSSRFINTVQGVLKQIKYPTGGNTVYEYELNTIAGATSDTNPVLEGKSVFFDENKNQQQVSFSIPNSVSPGSVRVKYHCTTGTYNPQFDVAINGDNYVKTFAGESLGEGEYLTIPSGNYTINVIQNGEFEEGYFSIFWINNVSTVSVPVNIPVGGLRIKAINDYAGLGLKPKVRSYTYNQSENSAFSSGKTFNSPQYGYYYTRSTFTDPNADTPENYWRECSFYVQSSTSHLPLSGLQYSNAVYPEVQEKRYDEAGNDLGSTNNVYSYVYDLQSGESYPSISSTSLEWMSGNLLKSEIYENVNNNYQLRQKTINTYNYNLTDSIAVLGNILSYPSQPNEVHAIGASISVQSPEIRVNNYGFFNQQAFFEVGYYKLISAWLQLTKTETESYEKGSTVTAKTVKEYFYDNPAHAQLTRTRTLNSLGEEINNLTLYPQDYLLQPGFINDLVAKHNIVPIESIGFKKTAEGSYQITDGDLTEFKDGGQGLISNIYQLNRANPIPLANFKFSNSQMGYLPSYSQIGNYSKDNNYELKGTFTFYDKKFNPAEFKLEKGMTTSYLWGYSHQYPIAEIKNADYSAVISALGGQNNVDSWGRRENPILNEIANFLSPLRVSPLLKGSHITTYTYKPLVGMTSMTDPKGMTTTYEYDDFGRLKWVKDQNGNILRENTYHYKN